MLGEHLGSRQPHVANVRWDPVLAERLAAVHDGRDGRDRVAAAARRAGLSPALVIALGRTLMFGGDEESQPGSGANLLTVKGAKRDRQSQGGLQMLSPRKVNAVAGSYAQLLAQGTGAPQQGRRHGDPVVSRPVALQFLLAPRQRHSGKFPETVLGREG